MTMMRVWGESRSMTSISVMSGARQRSKDRVWLWWCGEQKQYNNRLYVDFLH